MMIGRCWRSGVKRNIRENQTVSLLHSHKAGISNYLSVYLALCLFRFLSL